MWGIKKVKLKELTGIYLYDLNVFTREKNIIIVKF
jgi:hypothetical protein